MSSRTITLYSTHAHCNFIRLYAYNFDHSETCFRVKFIYSFDLSNPCTDNRSDLVTLRDQYIQGEEEPDEARTSARGRRVVKRKSGVSDNEVHFTHFIL